MRIIEFGTFNWEKWLRYEFNKFRLFEIISGGF
jgi:hypothetical protein